MKGPALNKWLFTIIICLSAKALNAQLSIAEVFSDNMVLQREKPVTLWGRAAPGMVIHVLFSNQTANAVTDAAGKWQLVLNPMPASFSPETLMITTAAGGMELKNILVGDVWLCSGQSNMEYPLDWKLKKYAAPKKGVDESADALAKPGADAIRYLYVEKSLNKTPALPTKGWFTSKDTLVRYISAAGYFFAREVFEKTNVPIGIISSSWGGTRIEQWQPDWSYRQSTFFKDSITGPDFKINGMHPGQMYQGLIAPLVPYAIKGVLWYQGESNATVEDQNIYPEKFKLLVDTWRTLFKDDQLPFYYVQIAPYLYTRRKDAIPHSAVLLPEFWEAQTKCLRIKNTGMVVTTDLVDDLTNIHPSYKWVVGHRLALLALHNDYHFNEVEESGPVFYKMKKKKSAIVLQFTHGGTSLMSSDGQPLNWFEIAGKDKAFVPATAIIQGTTIIVSAPGVTKPQQVRFAWNEKAQPNLVNSAGLPAVPFRTNK